MPTTSTAPYSAGQAVEVYRPDFATPGFPETWQAATVELVTRLDNGLFDVTLRLDEGLVVVQRVGKRGGNKNLRAA